MKIRVLSWAAVERGEAEGADGIISIRPSAEHDAENLDLALAQATGGEVGAVLVQRFDDIAIPAFGPYCGPVIEHVAEALEFGRRIAVQTPEGSLVVHCQMGVSRSAAVALALLAQELGPGAEAAAVAALLRGDPEGRMHPNSLLVSMADSCLFRYGRLEAALADACPRYVKWRDHWREVALDPERHWRQARRIRTRRRSE
ncbi:hypothetical protein [Azospirillum himalayense]|uniref:Tyrosine specific protein phosphatases domain-containing protein n=1 Tax=Azospirillum himalayense TaxID=654847 RepID=A0ABW0FZ12_9PROT